jgi:hypothetical protein
MADLKIKATSGNLVLADDGGDAAITVASNGTTTFAENVTLSGTANNIGTIAGNTTFTNNVTADEFITSDNSYVGKIGQSCRMYLTSSLASLSSGAKHIADYAMTTDYNEDTSLFTPQTSATKSGIKILVAGKYLFTWKMYFEAGSSANGYQTEYLSEVSSGNGLLDKTYHIVGHDGMWSGVEYFMLSRSTVLQISANNIINMFFSRTAGTTSLNGGVNGTSIVATFLHS